MRKFLSDNLWEMITFLGASSAFVGLAAWVHLPAALTVSGVSLVIFGLWGARSWGS